MINNRLTYPSISRLPTVYEELGLFPTAELTFSFLLTAEPEYHSSLLPQFTHHLQIQRFWA